MRDAVMQDAPPNGAVEGSRIELFNRERARQATNANLTNQSETGLYASEATRLAICIHLLHAWRHDESTTHIRTLVEQSSSSLAHAINPSAMRGAIFSQIANNGALVTAM